MPTVLRIDGFRFFFYSNEGSEPVHVHVAQAECEAKFWLNPVSLAKNDGFRSSNLMTLIALVRANEAILMATWKEFFAKDEKEELAE